MRKVEDLIEDYEFGSLVEDRNLWGVLGFSKAYLSKSSPAACRLLDILGDLMVARIQEVREEYENDVEQG